MGRRGCATHKSVVFPKTCFNSLRLEVSSQVPRIVSKCAKVSKFLSEKCRLQQHPKSICSESEEGQSTERNHERYTISSIANFVLTCLCDIRKFLLFSPSSGKGHSIKMAHRGIIFDHLGKQSRI